MRASDSDGLCFNKKKIVICLLSIMRYGQLTVPLLKSEGPQGDKVQIKYAVPVFGNGITRLFWCAWVTDCAPFCWILPEVSC